MKNLYLLLVILLSSTFSWAQKVNVGLRFQSAFPSTNYETSSTDPLFSVVPENAAPGMGIGGLFTLEYQLNQNIALGLEAGFINFDEEKYQSDVTVLFFTLQESAAVQAQAVPLLLTANYSFLENNFRPYLGVGAGYLFYSPSIKIDQLLTKATINLENQDGFLVSPRVGVRYSFLKNWSLDIQGQYNYAFNAATVNGFAELSDNASAEIVQDVSLGATSYFTVNIGIVYTLLQK